MSAKDWSGQVMPCHVSSGQARLHHIISGHFEASGPAIDLVSCFDKTFYDIFLIVEDIIIHLALILFSREG